MGLIPFLWNYAVWHYSEAILDIYRVWLNFIWFLYHFFSIPILFSTYFDPWRRLGEKGGRNILDFGRIFEALIVNTIMRIVGILMRTAVMFVGFTALLFAILAGPLFLIIWLLAPVIIFVMFLTGISYVFKN